MSKEYLRYLYRSRKVLWYFVFFVFLAISFTPFLDSFAPKNQRIKNLYTIATGLSMILTVVLPVLFFSVYHRRKSADQYFSLAIDRKTLLVSTLGFLYGYILLFWLSSTLIGQCFLGFTSNYGNMLGVTALSLAVLLLVFTALFLIANNLFDGIVVMTAYSFIFFVILIVEKSFVSNIVAGQSDEAIPWLSELFSLFSPALIAILQHIRILEGFSEGVKTVGFFPNWVHLSLLIGYGVLACVALKKYFIERKSENAELVSNDPFAYPFIIHFYLIGLMAAISFQTLRMDKFTAVVLILLVLVAYMVAMFVYRRRISLSWKNILTFVVVLVLSFGFSYTGIKTKGFGFAYRYKLNVGETLHYSVYEYSDIYKHIDISIPTKDLAKYQEVISILEHFRHEEIDHFYQDSKRFYRTGHFQVFNTIKNGKYERSTNHYSYPAHRYFHENELETLKKYPEIVTFVEKE